jgi:hypothetical protein
MQAKKEITQKRRTRSGRVDFDENLGKIDMISL